MARICHTRAVGRLLYAASGSVAFFLFVRIFENINAMVLSPKSFAVFSMMPYSFIVVFSSEIILGSDSIPYMCVSEK